MWSGLLHCLLVFIGGGFGALSRFGVEHLGIFEQNKYYYTVGINVTGCITIGILWALFQHWNLDRGWYLLAITGFLGGYTTYSAFTLDAMELIEAGMAGRAIFYIAITLIGGLGGCALGLMVTQHILKQI